MAAADWLNLPRMIFHVMTFSRLCFITYQISAPPPPQKKWTVICEFCKSENVFKRKEKGFAYFEFDSVIFNGNFLYVRLDKDNVSLSNLAEGGGGGWYRGVNLPPP